MSSGYKRKKVDPLELNFTILSSSSPSKNANTSFSAAQKTKYYYSKFISTNSDPKKALTPYTGWKKVISELKTHFQNISKLEAYVNQKDWTVRIKTTSEANHIKIQSIKKSDAFGGITLSEKEKTFHLAIRKLDTDIDLNSTTFEKIRTEHGIVNVKRLEKQGTKLDIVHLTLNDEYKYKILLNNPMIEIMENYWKPIEEWKFKPRPDQCFNCQKFGHSYANCSSPKPVCLRCAGDHKHSDCTKDRTKGPFKCANCNGNHAAVDKACPALKSHMEIKQSKAVKRPSEETTTRVHHEGVTYGQTMNSTQLVRTDKHTVSAESIIRFIYDVCKDFSEIQEDLNSSNQPAATFLNMINHHMPQLHSQMEAYIKRDQAAEEGKDDEGDQEAGQLESMNQNSAMTSNE